jgi:putative ABC transport system permease protein
MSIFRLALKSIKSRKATFFLTFISIALSVMLLLSVQIIKKEADSGFMQTISGTDLIIGPKSSQIELLLYSVFHIGTPNTLMEYKSYEKIKSNPKVKWAIPISLGDSHKGYKVVATNENFFKHYSFANGKKVEFEQGKVFEDMFHVVLGYEVAKKLNYKLGDNIVLSHGDAEVSFIHHDELPLKVSGILKPTHTPVDKTLIVTLHAMESIHDDSHNHFMHRPNKKTEQHNEHHENEKHHDESHEKEHDEHEEHHEDEHHDHEEKEHDEHHEDEKHHDESHEKEHDEHEDHHEDEHHDHEEKEHNEHHEDNKHHAESHEKEHDEHNKDENANSSSEVFKENISHKVAKRLKKLPKKISAVYVGMNSKSAIFNLQREINNNKQEPLSAIMPALAVQDLWNFFDIVQITLNIISTIVVLIGLLGMLSLILMGVQNRRKEMAILRSIGATPFDIGRLIVGEAAIVCGISIGLGVVFLYVALFSLSQPLYDTFGFYLQIQPLSLQEFAILGFIECSAILISFIPAYKIYKHSLVDGMNTQI